MDAVSEDDDNWNFERVVGLDRMELVGVKQHFRGVQKSCRVKHRKVPGRVAKAAELTD